MVRHRLAADASAVLVLICRLREVASFTKFEAASRFGVIRAIAALVFAARFEVATSRLACRIEHVMMRTWPRKPPLRMELGTIAYRS